MAMAAGKALTSRTLPNAMASSPATRQTTPAQVSPGKPSKSEVSPIARERARLRNLARKGRQAVPAPVKATVTQLDFVPDTEQQVEDYESDHFQDAQEPDHFQDAHEPFQSELKQAQGLMSVRQLIDKTKLLESQFRSNDEILKKLTSRSHSVQTALNELGLDSQVLKVPTWDPPKTTAQLFDQLDFSALSQSDPASETEDSDQQEESDSEEDTSEHEDSESGDKCNSDPPTTALLGPLLPDTEPAGGTDIPVEVPIEVIPLESDNSGEDSMDDVRVLTPEDTQAGKNPRAPREFIPRDHVLALVSYYEKQYAAYCKAIAPKNPSQLVPNKGWKDVFTAYKQNYPQSRFKEESLKEPLRQQLRDLAKEKEKLTINVEDGGDPEQDEELLTRLMATKSWRAKGLLQERLAVADRVSADSGKKKKDSSAKKTTPTTPDVGSNVSGQTDTKIGSIGERQGGRYATKLQNLRDAKEGINSMLVVMTSMNEEKKLENGKKRQLAEGKAALTDAKRRELEERSTVLAAQRIALDEQAKMNRITLLKEQRSLGLIDEQ